MSMTLSRRSLLKAAAAGSALLTMPRFLAGCGQPDASAPGGAVPDNPFLTWFGIDEQVIREVMAELTARGADDAELFFQHSKASSIVMEDGIISRASTSVDQGVGLRVVIGDAIGYAFTEDLTKESMLSAAKTAAAIANAGAVTDPMTFQYPTLPSFHAIEVPWSEVEVDKKLPILQRAEALAKAGDPAVDKVMVFWTDGEDRVLIADMHGTISTDYRPMARLWVQVTAKKGDEVQSNSANIAGRRGFEWYTEENLAMVAKQAVDRTMILFDARRPPAGELPVILSAGASGILLHEAIGHGLEADFNRKGTSIFSDKMGEKIAADFVTIVDDGTRPFERGAVNVDDEGTPGQRTELVTNGVLTSYMHDKMSARHYNVAPTGNGRRESFRHAPLPRMRATYMENGPHTRDEIVASVDKGIIAETFTNGQVQIGAGDFTFYIKNGWLIEGGKITSPIKDCNIIGNGPDALSKITMAANDFHLDTGGWTCGKDGQGVPVSQGLPTVLVSKMTVGGEDA